MECLGQRDGRFDTPVTVKNSAIKNDMDVTNAVLSCRLCGLAGMVIGVSAAFDHGSGNAAGCRERLVGFNSEGLRSCAVSWISDQRNWRSTQTGLGSGRHPLQGGMESG